MAKIVLIPSGMSTWIVPADCQSAQIDCIGEGQNGQGTAGAGAGGAAGAFARKNTIALTPGASIPVQIGSGNSGDDTWFSTSTTVKAQSGVNGGLASGSIGDVTHSGGYGGAVTDGAGGGGGGAAGPSGGGSPGGAGAVTGGTGGAGDTGLGGFGGPAATNGGPGAEYALTAGGHTGAGGGGGGANHNGISPGGLGGALGAGGGGNNNILAGSGAGSQGGIIVTYNPITTASFSMAGAASFASVGGSNQPAPAAIAGHGVLAATGKSTNAQAPQIVGHGSLAATGRSTARASSSATGAGAFVGATQAIVAAAFAIAGAATFSPVGDSTAEAQTTIVASGVFSPAGTAVRNASVAITGQGDFVASTQSTATATFSMVGAGAVSAHGTALKPSALAVSGIGALAVTGARRAASALSVTGQGSMAATGASRASAVTTIAGHGVLAAPTNAIHAASTAVVGQGSFQAPTAETAAASLSAAGQGVLTAGGNALKPASLSVTGDGVFAAGGYSITVKPVALSVTGAGAFASSPVGVAATAFAMAGSASLQAPGQFAPNPSGQSVREALGNQSQLKAGLDQGLNTLSADQAICFQKYVKVILPLDQYVFWCRADLLSPSALFNANQYNALAFGQPAVILQGPNEICARGSLHHSIVNRQDADQAVAVNHMVFTSEVEIQELNDVNPQMIYMACVDGELFAFSERKSFYKNAGIYHYAGDAVFPTMRSQIIDNIRGFDAQSVVVSNSLPLWLTLNQFFPVFPAYLVPDNTRPPFATVDVQATTALQPIPRIDQTSSHYQLAQDRVRITIFGTRNSQALDYQDAVQAFMDPAVGGGTSMGLTSAPIVVDERQWQTEINALAMKKTLTYEVSYYQQRIRNVARQYILSCIPTLLL